MGSWGSPGSPDGSPLHGVAPDGSLHGVPHEQAEEMRSVAISSQLESLDPDVAQVPTAAELLTHEQAPGINLSELQVMQVYDYVDELRSSLRYCNALLECSHNPTTRALKPTATGGIGQHEKWRALNEMMEKFQFDEAHDYVRKELHPAWHRAKEAVASPTRSADTAAEERRAGQPWDRRGTKDSAWAQLKRGAQGDVGSNVTKAPRASWSSSSWRSGTGYK